MSTKVDNIQITLEKISNLRNRNKTLEKQKTEEMKKMLQNVINRHKTLNDKIKHTLTGGSKKQKKVKKKGKKKILNKNNNKKKIKK